MMVDVSGAPSTLSLTPRPVASSIEELLAGATSREPFAHGDGKSQVPMERVVIDGERFVLKHLHVDLDWIARCYGDLRCRPLVVWQSGLLDFMPEEIDHTIVGAASGLGRNGWGAAILMRDVGRELVPEGDAPLSLEQHLSFLDHMAALHARFWGFTDTVGLNPYAHRWIPFGPAMLDIEQAQGWRDPVPRIAFEGWDRFRSRAPREVVEVIDALRHDLDPLVAATRRTPTTFVHGDWKLGNLGTTTARRTILIDWQSPGESPAVSDLVWYLAINAARLPQSKDEAIDAYRAALVRHGIDSAGWWDAQRSLCLLGGLVLFGWEKALGADDELGWWCDRAREGVAYL